MFNSFFRKLKIFWIQALTRPGGPKTILSASHSMAKKKKSEAELSLFSSDSVVSESALSSASQPQLGSRLHKSITVVCACIMRQGGQQVLLSMRRAPGVAGLDGKWELPGGKVEFGETPEQTVVREIREELGMAIVPTRLLPYLHTNLWKYEHSVQHVILACYECEMKEKGVLSSHGDDARWFHVNQIQFDSTLPGTREFVSLATRNEWFDKVYIEFECVDSSRNASRRFAVATQSTLFSKYGLVKYYWGGVGANRRMEREEFESPRELDQQIFETAKRRLAAGYHIRALKGPDRHPEVLTRVRELAKQWHEPLPEADCASAI
jgi:8-oxo-dGTP diphosphatase